MEFTTIESCKNFMTDLTEFNDIRLQSFVDTVNYLLTEKVKEKYSDEADVNNPIPPLITISQAWVEYLYKKPLGVKSENDIDVSVTYIGGQAMPSELADMLSSYTDIQESSGGIVGVSYV